jgi:hypothetical protein
MSLDDIASQLVNPALEITSPIEAAKQRAAWMAVDKHVLHEYKVGLVGLSANHITERGSGDRDRDWYIHPQTFYGTRLTIICRIYGTIRRREDYSSRDRSKQGPNLHTDR